MRRLAIALALLPSLSFAEGLGDRLPGSTVVCKFTTVTASGPTAISGGTIKVYKDSSTTTETTTGVTYTSGFDSVTGLNSVAVDTSADGTFYAAGSDFNVIITAGTVGGTSVIGYSPCSFSLRHGSTTVDSSGYVTAASVATGGITAASIAADAIGASELAADAVTEIQSGLATASNVAGVQSDTDDIQARLPAALAGGRMDSSVGAYQTGLTPLQPTTAGRTLDVTATGEAGIDWANIGSPTTTVNLSGTTIASAGAGSAPTAAQNAAAVWNALLADYTAAGTMGYNLNLLDDIYGFTSSIGGSTITIVSPLLNGDTLELVAGDAYDLDHARALDDFALTGFSTLSGATVNLVIDGVMSVTATSITNVGTATQTPIFELTAAQTALLTRKGERAYRYQIQATWAADTPAQPAVLAQGTVTVVKRAAP